MDFAAARYNMMNGVLRPNKITDRNLLSGFSSVPRELFVREEMCHVAYADSDVSAPNDRTLLAPLPTATLLQALEVSETDKVLVVEAGTGYVASVLAGLASSVNAAEDDTALQALMEKNIAALRLKNVKVSSLEAIQNGKKAVFDVIFMDSPVGEVPASLFELLKEGGRLGAFVESKKGMLEALVWTKKGKACESVSVLERTWSGTAPTFPGQVGFVF